jgi:hypothetical protein
MSNQVTLTFVRNPIRVSLSNYKGVDRLDVRHHYYTDNEELRPTKKGVSVKMADAEALVTAITQALETSSEVEASIQHYNPIKVKLSVFKGKERLDVRHYYTDKTGQLAFTQKGVNLPVENAQAFVTALREVIESATANERAASVEV